MKEAVEISFSQPLAIRDGSNMEQKSNKYYCVCGVVMIENKVLLVRHTYGMAKNKLLIPGGFCKDKEMPEIAVSREIYEETGVKAEAVSVIGIQFKPEQWCVVFNMKYIDGIPTSDMKENSEVKLLTIDDALKEDALTNMTRQILTSIRDNTALELKDSGYLAPNCKRDEYKLFGNVAVSHIDFRY